MPDIRVIPARAGMRLRHIPSGVELPDGGGMWPEDSFTFRRIVDGDVTRAPADEKAEEGPAPLVPEVAPSPAVPDEVHAYEFTADADPTELAPSAGGSN